LTYYGFYEKEVLPLYREALIQAGHDPVRGGVIPVRHAYLAESDAEARHDVEDNYEVMPHFQ
jgi:hypothetical protein